jgi:hypothetical protein
MGKDPVHCVRRGFTSPLRTTHDSARHAYCIRMVITNCFVGLADPGCHPPQM